MESEFKTFIEETLSPERAAILSRADAVLQNIGRREHQVGIENVLAIADNADTATTVQRIEDTLFYALTEAVGEYSIGVSKPNFPILTSILTGMHDIVEYDDHQRILDLCDENGTAEEKFSMILAELYNADPTEYLKTIDYVTPSLIIRIIDIVTQRVDELEGDVDDEEIEEVIDQAEGNDIEDGIAAHVKRFVELYRPEGFQSLLRNGYRLGYDLDVYLQRTLDPEIKDPIYLAKEYLVAALASGETLDTARANASDRLEHKIDDLYVLQQGIQKMAGYQI
jgi:hypothetical protein